MTSGYFATIFLASSLCPFITLFMCPSSLPPEYMVAPPPDLSTVVGSSGDGLSMFFCNHCVVLAMNSFAGTGG